MVPGKIFKSSEDSAINRNGALHGLERILNADEVMLSNCALFLVIDVVAELYLRENISQYDVLNIGVTPTHKDNLLNLYNIIYQSAFESSLNNGRINIVNNLFLNKRIYEEYDIPKLNAEKRNIIATMQIKEQKSFIELQTSQRWYQLQYVISKSI